MTFILCVGKLHTTPMKEPPSSREQQHRRDDSREGRDGGREARDNGREGRDSGREGGREGKSRDNSSSNGIKKEDLQQLNTIKQLLKNPPAVKVSLKI